MNSEIKTKNCSIIEKINSECGQGTAEYAILIGVIVIIAVVAILVFGDALGDAWDQANEHMQTVLHWTHGS